MIDRSYLPFQSAREYCDSKMQKWMGFFLSEHTSALGDDAIKINFSTDLSLKEKLFLLGQVYANQQTIRVTVRDKKTMNSLIGTVRHVTGGSFLIKTDMGFEHIEIEKILKIEAWEERKHESA